MYQYLNRAKWSGHIEKHIRKLEEQERLNGNKTVKCPRPGSLCPESFSTILQLQFHLQDFHGIDMIREPRAQKRLRVESVEVLPGAKKRPRQKYKQEDPGEYFFVNSTMKIIGGQSLDPFIASSGHSISSGSLVNAISGTETPLSSTSDKAPIDSARLP
jgi:hypothetical protein